MTVKTVLTPLGNRILAKRIESGDKTVGGILMPDSAKKQEDIAIVVALGTGKKNDKGDAIAFDVKVGDKILMERYRGSEIELEGKKYLMLNMDDIIGVFE
jgi:chaperonin GroES